MAHYVILALLLVGLASGQTLKDSGQNSGSAGNPNNSQSLTLSGCTGASTLFVEMVGWNSSTIVTPTYDIGSGPVAFATGATDATAQYDDGGAGTIGRLYWKTGLTGVTSVTFASTTDYGKLIASCWSGVTTYVAKGTANNGVVNATATASGQLAITVFAYDQTGTGSFAWTPSASTTVIVQSAQSASPRYFGGGMGYAITPASGTNTATWAGLGNSGTAMVIFDVGSPPPTSAHRNKFLKH